MSRIVCKLIALLLTATLIAAVLCGCETPVSHQAKPERQLSYLEQLFEQGIVIQNNITLERIDDGNYNEYFQIEGLKDKVVEQKINDRIKEQYDYMMSGDFIPPYRGVIPTLAHYEDADIHDIGVSMGDYWNGSGLLSLCMYGSHYYQSDEDSFFMNYCVPLNFDLSDGRELTLADMFPEGTDYISVINENIAAQLMKMGFDSGYDGADDESDYYSNEMIMTAPFKGISPEQKFLFDGYGRLYLIIDYDTPEFYTDFNFGELIINPESGVVPVGKGDWSIFEDESKTYNLVGRYYDQLTENTVEDSSDDGHVNIQYRLKSYEGVPAELYEECGKIWKTLDDMPLSLDIACEYSKNTYGDDWGVRCYKNTDVGNVRYGKYIDVYCDMRLIPEPKVETLYSDEQTESCERALCYDSVSGKLITSPAELFREPDKALDIIREAIIKDVMREQENADIDEDLLREMLKGLLERINGVSLSDDCICLTYGMEYFYLGEYIADALGLDDTRYSVEYSCKNVYFEDIGCENLVIFD